MRILHVALRQDWDQARQSGEYLVSSRGRTLAQEGFIHASTSAQVNGVLARFYADVDPGDLTLLVVDLEALEVAGSPVRWDQVPGAPAPFPHVYGPIVPSAVVANLPLAGEGGAHRSGAGPVLPDLIGWDVAAGEPVTG